MARRFPVKAFITVTIITALLTSCQSPRIRKEKPETIRVMILYTNDMHGAIKPVKARWINEVEPPFAGGMAVLASVVSKIKSTSRFPRAEYLLLDAGDIFQGTPEGDLTEGKLSIELMNYMDYDAAAVGNHEFDRGVEKLIALSRLAQFPFLCANLIADDTGRNPDYVQPYIISDCGGVRVGIIGILTDSTPECLAYTPEGLTFDDERKTIKKYIEELEELNINFIMLLTHVGFEEDKKLASEFDSVDIIIGGHSHTRLPDAYVDTETGVIVCQTGAKCITLGVLDVTFDTATGRILRWDNRLIELLVEKYGEDETVRNIIENYSKEIDKLMDKYVGTLTKPLNKEERLDECGSSGLGNFITYVMRKTTGSDIAFHNRTGIRYNLPSGKLTKRDVYKVAPFGNTLVTMRLGGDQVRRILDNNLTSASFLEFSGLALRLRKTGDGKIVINDIYVNGKPIEDNHLYSVVTNSFLASRGDGHGRFSEARDVVDRGYLLRDRIEEYISENDPLDPLEFLKSVNIKED